jgi:glycosyltransferase involved in cell wall biosynthesis
MWGGIATYTLDMARGLAALGHRVHVITRTWEAERVEDVDGIRVHRVYLPEPSWRWGTWFINLKFHEARQIVMWNRQVKRALDRVLGEEGLDVVECPEYHAQGLMATVGRLDLPLVVRLHIPAFVCRRLNGLAIGGCEWDTRLSEGVEYWMTRRADLITSPSLAMARDVARGWNLNESDIRVIPNPADERLFASADHVRHDGRTVVFAGRLERRKGVDVLAKAVPLVLKDFPAARFELYGRDHPSSPDGGGSMAAYLKKELKATGVPDGTVIINPARPRQELPAVYRRGTVCVVPSLYESFGYTCLEAMASGTAVVASDAGSLPELVANQEDGLLVRADDPAALASAIVRVLNEPMLRDQLATAARATVMRRFARDLVCRQTVETYRDIVRH